MRLGAQVIADRLKTFGVALHIAEKSSAIERTAGYFLLKLDATAEEVTVTGFKRGELEEASRSYLAVETEIEGKQGQDAVLVSVDSVASLRRAYPNYFLDTSVFIGLVNDTLGTPAISSVGAG